MEVRWLRFLLHAPGASLCLMTITLNFLFVRYRGLCSEARVEYNERAAIDLVC